MGRTDDKVIAEFVSNLKKVIKLEKVILFGSRAKDDYLVDSDYDFIIVSPDFSKMHFLERMSFVYDYWPSDLALEALCYTPEEFNRKKEQLTIVKVAVDEGIEIAA